MDGLGKMVNEMIQKRMQDQYAKWNSDDPEDRKKIRHKHLQQAYDRIAAALPDDQISELKNYANLFFETEAENEAFFYRLGIGDGLRLKKAFRKQSNALEMTDSCFTSPRIFHISIVTVENS